MTDYGRSQRGYSPFVQRVAPVLNVVTVVPVLDTSAYAGSDLLADCIEVPSAVGEAGGAAILQSVTILDEADQGVAMELFLCDTEVDFGTLNSAPSISDADARTIVGRVAVASADWLDIGGSRIVTKNNLNMMVQAAAGSRSLWLAIINGSGTPTFAASSLRVKLGFAG